MQEMYVYSYIMEVGLQKRTFGFKEATSYLFEIEGGPQKYPLSSKIICRPTLPLPPLIMTRPLLHLLRHVISAIGTLLFSTEDITESKIGKIIKGDDNMDSEEESKL